jgi:glycosyltransferase involved in cell wall biosynthesis
MKRLKILLSAYACEPDKGSEPGVGWNISKSLAQFHEVWVLTRENNRNKILNSLSKSKCNIKNLHFVYYDLPRPLLWMKRRKIISINLYYWLWQFFSVFFVKRIIKQNNIDLIHHITFNQFRGPLPGYFLNIPFIIGPIGGAEKIPFPLFKDLTLSHKFKELLRYSKLELISFKIYNLLSKNQKVYIFSNNSTYQWLKSTIKNSKYYIYPAIGINSKENQNTVKEKYKLKAKSNGKQNYKLVYIGRFESWKGIEILINAISLANTKLCTNEILFNLKLVGARSRKDRKNIENLIKKYSAQNYVEVIKFLPREKVIQLIKESDIVTYPAFRDSGSMAVLEAMAAGKVVICFDSQGQDWVRDDCAIKVPFGKTYQETLNNFVFKLLQILKYPEQLNTIGYNAKMYASKELTWEAKAKFFIKVYRNIIMNQQR